MIVAAAPQGTTSRGVFKIALEIIASQGAVPEHLKQNADEVLTVAKRIAETQSSQPLGLPKESLSLAVNLRSSQDIAREMSSIDSVTSITPETAQKLLRVMEPKLAKLF